MGLVLVNISFVVGATMFLLQQEEYRHEERVILGELLRACPAKPIESKPTTSKIASGGKP